MGSMPLSDEPNYRAASDALTQLRHERGLTIAELAKRAGVDEATVYGLASGKTPGTARTWFRLATVLKVRTGDLLNHLHDPA